MGVWATFVTSIMIIVDSSTMSYIYLVLKRDK